MTDQILSDNITTSHWTLSLSVISPFLTQGYTGQFGVDTVAARNYQGNVYIPGSLLKGVFRSVLKDYDTVPEENLGEMQALRDAARKILQWLGQGSDKNNAEIDTNIPHRGCVNFSDLTAENGESDARNILYRIAIDDFTGAVKQGSFQVIELPYPVGEAISFEGIVRFQGTENEADLFKEALRKALSLVPAIGAFKSVGFGRIDQQQGIKLSPLGKPQKLQESSPVRSFNENGYISVRMSFDRPIVMSAQRVTNNLFKGQVIFPGSVLKAALAEKINLMEDKRKFTDLLSAVRFSHSYPVKKESDDLSETAFLLPLSVYVTQKNDTEFGDYLFDQPNQNHRLSEEFVFQNDWKEKKFTQASELLGCDKSPGFEMRTRTKISQETQIAFDDEDGGQLFSYQSVIADKHDWVCNLYLDPDVVFPDSLKAEFLDILSGHIFQIGKSKAYCEISLFERSPEDNPAYQTGDDILITLKTDGLLLNIDEVRNSKNIETLYRDYFSALGLELKDYMASQKMSGGYLAMRYGEETHYKPWLLTERGSVFRVRIEEKCNLMALVNNGLPVGENMSGDWRKNPYIPQNGYGEIVVNINETLLSKLNSKGV